MKLSNLPKQIERRKKRLGRGHGSGKVKTGGRGTKGQKSRETVRIGFEGGQLPIVKRLPLLRGKGKNRSYGVKPFALAVGRLESLPKGTSVTVATLQKHGIIGLDVTRVKILGGGELTVALTVALPCSASAKKTIEKAKGTIVG